MPLDVSTWLLISESVPVESTRLPSVESAIVLGAPAASAALISGNWSSGAVKITAIGSIWAMVTMPVCVAALTMLPTSTCRSPTMPEIGALTVA